MHQIQSVLSSFTDSKSLFDQMIGFFMRALHTHTHTKETLSACKPNRYSDVDALVICFISIVYVFIDRCQNSIEYRFYFILFILSIYESRMRCLNQEKMNRFSWDLSKNLYVISWCWWFQCYSTSFSILCLGSIRRCAVTMFAEACRLHNIYGSILKEGTCR